MTSLDCCTIRMSCDPQSKQNSQLYAARQKQQSATKSIDRGDIFEGLAKALRESLSHSWQTGVAKLRHQSNNSQESYAVSLENPSESLNGEWRRESPLGSLMLVKSRRWRRCPPLSLRMATKSARSSRPSTYVS